MATTLLNAVTANGAGSGSALAGPLTVQVYGTFAGATVHVESSVDGTNYSPCGRPAQLRQPGLVNIETHGTTTIRCVVSGVSATTSVSAKTPT